MGTLLAEALALTGRHLEGSDVLETQREPPGSRSRSYRVPCKRDGWRLPGDAEAGAVGGRETGAGRAATGAAGRDGDGSRGLETEHPFTTKKSIFPSCSSC